MSIYKGTELLAGVATNTISNSHNLFDFIWRDSIINSMEWVNANYFSWLDGALYVAAYNHLLADYNGGTSQTETVGSYTITYVLADDGHKITADETTVANIYNESGVSWYYILDTANTRFKLPRTKYGFTGLRDSVGKYVTESLPNFEIASKSSQAVQLNTAPAGTKLTGVAGSYGISTSGSAYSNSGPAGLVLSGSALTAGTKFGADNSTYQDNAPVQQRATQMYLYFYVGQFSQSATEQTAGLNAELFNGKLDLDLGNITNTSKETIVGWGMPDYTRPTVITSSVNSTDGYTADEDCFVKCYCSAKASNATAPTIKISGADYTLLERSANNQFYNSCFWIMPLTKGQNIQCNSYTGVTWSFQMFPVKG